MSGSPMESPSTSEESEDVSRSMVVPEGASRSIETGKESEISFPAASDAVARNRMFSVAVVPSPADRRSTLTVYVQSPLPFWVQLLPLAASEPLGMAKRL